MPKILGYLEKDEIAEIKLNSRMASGQYAENIEKRKRVTNEFWLASLAV